MKTLLYHNHHQLPFWHRPSQPYAAYSPALSADWMFQEWDEERDGLVLKNYKDSGGWALPMLNGLHNLDLPLLAHVSFSVQENKVQSLKRSWVQISTVPEGVDEAGLPLVVEPSESEDKPGVNVTGLWGFDNGTKSPWEFAWAKEVSEAERMTSDFWRSAFLNQLSLARQKAIQDAVSAASKAAATATYVTLFNSVPLEV